MDTATELADLAARRGITRAVQNYLRGLDRLDPALQLSTFASDAWVDCGLFSGDGAAFTAFCQDFLGAMDGSHHLLGQVTLDLHADGQSASGECYFQAWHGTRDEHGTARDLIIAGRYIDEYTCENGEWRIRRRKLITDWVKDDPANHGFYAANPATLRGGRRGADFSDTRTWPD